jgi:hypothetical protein
MKIEAEIAKLSKEIADLTLKLEATEHAFMHLLLEKFSPEDHREWTGDYDDFHTRYMETVNKSKT